VARDPDTLLRVAVFCGLAPTASGTIALLGWLAFRHPAFQILGLCTIFAEIRPSESWRLHTGSGARTGLIP
jgi:hypothetical protein